MAFLYLIFELLKGVIINFPGHHLRDELANTFNLFLWCFKPYQSVGGELNISCDICHSNCDNNSHTRIILNRKQDDRDKVHERFA